MNTLSEKEINNILDDYEKRKKEEEVIEEYKKNCENFKNKKCEGFVFLNSKNGCNACMKNKTYDLNNAMPPIATQEYGKFEMEKMRILKSSVNNCKLAFDDDFCRYKNIFNYCAFCNKEFRRKER